MMYEWKRAPGSRAGPGAMCDFIWSHAVQNVIFMGVQPAQGDVYRLCSRSQVRCDVPNVITESSPMWRSLLASRGQARCNVLSHYKSSFMLTSLKSPMRPILRFISFSSKKSFAWKSAPRDDITWRHHVTASRDGIPRRHHVTASRDDITWRHHVTTSRDDIRRRHHVTASGDGITWRHHVTTSRDGITWWHQATASNDSITRQHHATASRHGIKRRHHAIASREDITRLHHATASRDGITWRHHVTTSRDDITSRYHVTTSNDDITCWHHATASRDSITRRHHVTEVRIVWTVHLIAVHLLVRLRYIGDLVYVGFSAVFPTTGVCKTIYCSSVMAVNHSWSGSVMAVVLHWLRDDT